MVFRLDIAAREDAVDAVADPQVVAVVQDVADDRRVVDERPVGADEILGDVPLGGRLDARVLPRDGVVVDVDGAVHPAADHHGGGDRERVALPHAGATGVDVDEAGVSTRGGDQARRGTQRLRRRALGYVVSRSLWHGGASAFRGDGVESCATLKSNTSSARVNPLMSLPASRREDSHEVGGDLRSLSGPSLLQSL